MLKTRPIPGKNGTGAETGVSKPAKTFTQERVNEIMRKRVERSHQAFFNRYGVKDLRELDELFGKSRSYDATIQRYDELERLDNDLKTQHADLTKRYAYLKGNVNEKYIPDIEAYMKGKGLEINEANLINELKSHSDWVNKVSTVEVLGSEATLPSSPEAVDVASSLLGVDLH